MWKEESKYSKANTMPRLRRVAKPSAIWITNNEPCVGSTGMAGGTATATFAILVLSSALDDRFFSGGETGPLIEQTADLALQLADGPLSLQAFVFVECPLPRVIETDEFLKLAPSELQK